ncbi:MAG: hypothetical protein ACRDQA_00725 [Nocardioidaceae bacterium]
MAENEQQEPPTPEEPSRDLVPRAEEPTAPMTPGSGQPPAGPPDAEQWRQFQEFQRFQAYLRYTRSSEGLPQQGGEGDGGQEPVPLPEAPQQPPPPAQPPATLPPGPLQQAPQQSQLPQQSQEQQSQEQLLTIQQQLGEVVASQQRTERELNPPLWKKVLRSPWLHRLVVLIIVIALASWAYNHFFGSSGEEGQPAVPKAPPGQQGGLNAAPGRPDRTIQNLYASIATKGDATCNLFTKAGKRDFARDFHARDCSGAVGKIRKRVTDSNSYSILRFQDAVVTKTATTATISSCRVDVSGGPSLGAFTLTKQPTGGWYVSGHHRETCTADPSGTDAPTGTAPGPTH